MLLLLLLFYKQGGKQMMGRYSMGIGLGLFWWLYSRQAILSHSSSYTGQNNNRTHGGRIRLVVSMRKKKTHSHSVYAHVSILQQKFLILEIKPM